MHIIILASVELSPKGQFQAWNGGFRLKEGCGLERDFDDYFKFSGEI